MIYIAFILFTLFILAFAFYQWQYFLVFTPTYHRHGEFEDEFEILSITTDDGVELEGVVYEPQNPNATLLFFAGRSHDSVGLIKKLALTFEETRIITFNYRSYGRSGGRVNEKNILSDALKIAEVIKKNYGEFYILGFSIGSIVASYVASKISPLGVFLVGSFDSIACLAKTKHGLNLSWLMRYKFDNRKFVQNIDAPTYIYVSKDDEITYIENARNLKTHVKNLAHYMECDNLLHKELLWDEEVVTEINEVLR